MLLCTYLAFYVDPFDFLTGDDGGGVPRLVEVLTIAVKITMFGFGVSVFIRFCKNRWPSSKIENNTEEDLPVELGSLDNDISE